MQFNFCELDPAPTISNLFCKSKLMQTAELNLIFSSFSFSLSRCLLAEEPKLVQCKSRPLFLLLSFFHSVHLFACALMCWCDSERTVVDLSLTLFYERPFKPRPSALGQWSCGLRLAGSLKEQQVALPRWMLWCSSADAASCRGASLGSAL